MTTIRSITPELTIFSAPFSRFGVFKIGARMTAIKLANNDLVIVSAINHEPEVESTLRNLGRVAYLVAPDAEHHLSLEAYSKLYPEAKIIGVEGLKEKHPNLKFAKVYGDKAYDSVQIGWEAEIETVYFGAHRNKELAILHKKSKSLVQADLLFNLPAYEQYNGSSSSAGVMGFLNPFNKFAAGSSTQKKMTWNVLAADKSSFRQSLEAVKAWDFTRIIPCHGEVIEKDAKSTWDASFADFFTKPT